MLGILAKLLPQFISAANRETVSPVLDTYPVTGWITLAYKDGIYTAEAVGGESIKH